MRAVVHLASTDVRHCWPLLTAWIAVVILCASAPCAVPWLAGGDARVLSRLEVPAMLLTIAYSIVLFILVAQVVQADPLVGARAFWMTRPISPRTLLASKLVLLASVAVILPVVVEIVRMTLHGVPAAAQVGVALETGLSHTLLLSLLMAAAAVTESLPRLLMLVVVALAVLVSALVATIVLFGPRETPTFPGWSLLPDPTTGVLQIVLSIATASAAVAAQYVTRSRTWAATFAAAGIAITMLLPRVWPWPILQPRTNVPAWAHSAAALQPKIGPADAMRTMPTVSADGREWVGISAPLEIDGLEPRYTARIGIVDATIRVGEASLTSYRELFPIEPRRSGDPLHPTFGVQRTALQVDRVPTSRWQGGPVGMTLFSIDGSDLRKHTPGMGEYRGRARIALSEHVLEAALPLSVGAHHHRGAYAVTIHGVSERWGVVLLEAHESLAVSGFSRRAEPYYTYFLRNPRTREAVRGVWNPGDDFAVHLVPSFGMSIDRRSGFTARELLIRFDVEPGMDAHGITIDSSWLADAELVVMRTSRAGTVERTIHIPNFRLDLPSRSASSPTP